MKLDIDTAPIPYVDLGAQHAPLKSDLLAAAARVLDHGQFILGPEVDEFERAFAQMCGVKHALGVANGTDALVLALHACGIGAGDEVVTAPNSFVASASAVRLAGATPVFADVDDTYNLDPDAIERALTPRTKAILPVHLTGRPARMDAIMAIANEHGLVVVEDAAQAVGAAYDGQAVGTFGNAGCFSLHPLKTLNACGDGGVITTNDDALYEHLRVMRNLGLKTRDDCTEFAGNSRLDTLHAAFLLVKLPKLASWTEARRANAQAYRDRLDGVAGVRVPVDTDREYSVYHTFVIRAQRRDALQKFLASRGIGTSVHYPVPIHLSNAAKGLGYGRGDFPNAETQAAEILSLPVHEQVTERQITRVSDAIREFSMNESV
jgi:dTDP-4-amino-4,6-dideoxygalactose transaminase